MTAISSQYSFTGFDVPITHRDENDFEYTGEICSSAAHKVTLQHQVLL